ncbi:hypothetical protein Bbelb_428620, partial [Branchiostoma belcheri]
EPNTCYHYPEADCTVAAFVNFVLPEEMCGVEHKSAARANTTGGNRQICSQPPVAASSGGEKFTPRSHLRTPRQKLPRCTTMLKGPREFTRARVHPDARSPSPAGFEPITPLPLSSQGPFKRQARAWLGAFHGFSEGVVSEIPPPYYLFKAPGHWQESNFPEHAWLAPGPRHDGKGSSNGQGEIEHPHLPRCKLIFGLSELRRVRGVVGIGEGVCRPAVRPTITQPVRSSDAVAVCLLATGRWQLKRSVRKSQRAMSAFLGPRCNKSLRQVPHRARQAQAENGAQMLRGTAQKRSV